MKTIITISILLITILSYGQPDNPWKGKPKTIEEAYLYLDKMFDDTAKYTFMTLPEDIATSRLHSGFGMWMRNNWGLWGNSQLMQCLIDSGFIHPDDMSAIILKTYHRRLNDKPLNFHEDAERYIAYWEKAEGDGFSAGDLNADHDTNTTIEELMKFFPEGDTIVTSIFAEKKGIFQTYASSVRAIAVIKEKRIINWYCSY